MNKQSVKLFVVAVLLLMPCISFAVPGRHASYACGSCHIYGKNIGNRDATYVQNTCLTAGCHGGALAKQFVANDYANPFKTGSVSQNPIPLQSSHKWFGSDNVPAAGALPPTDMRPGGLNRTGYTGYLSCGRCHSVHGTSGVGSEIRPYLRMPNDTDQMCRDCHRSRDATTHIAGSHPVNVLYSSAKAKANSGLLRYPVANPVNPTGQVKLIKGLVLCSTCHRTHNTDSRTSTFDPWSTSQQFGRLSTSKGYLLKVDARGKSPNATNICTNCHTNKTAHNKLSQNVQCNDCHSGHVEYDAAAAGIPAEMVPNKYLVRRYLKYSTSGRVNKRIFYRYTGSSRKEFYNGAGKGVCQSCHYPPTDHYVGGTRAGAFPESGHLDCSSCHFHDAPNGSFSSGISLNCTICHGLPPMSNTVAGVGGRNANYTNYNEVTTPHAGHSANTGLYFNFSCNQCHKGAAPAMTEINNFVQVFINVTGNGIFTGTGATYTSRTGGVASDCNNVYCHSDGKGTLRGVRTYKLGQNPVQWGNNKLNTIITQGTECTTCHDGATYSSSHARHVTTMGYGCVSCHAATVISNNTTLITRSGGAHVNGAKDVEFSEVLPATRLTGSGPNANCSNLYCHSNGKGKAPVQAPVWGDLNSGKCGDCHKTRSFLNLTTGGHKTALHFPTSNDTDCVRCHTYASETATTHVNGILYAEIKYDATGCAINACHGTITAPVWTVSYAGKDVCTKCHGTLSTPAELTAARYKMAPSLPAGPDTGNVSADPKTGAHQTHLRFLNGFSNYSATNVDYLCQACHILPGSGTHANSLSTPVFSAVNLATNHGQMTATYTTTCNNTYCHNPAAVVGGTLNSANVGTGVAPIWTNYLYLDPAATRTQANCGKCHKTPADVGTFTSTETHVANVTQDCSGCHGHNGDNTGPVGQRHMDGILYGNGSCDTCHGYPPVTATEILSMRVPGNYENAKAEVASMGSGGIHARHLPASITSSQGFTPCKPCHPDSTAGLHKQGGVTVARANVTIFDATDFTYSFNSNRSRRYNNPTSYKCSNVSCHFQPTGAWFLP